MTPISPHISHLRPPDSSEATRGAPIPSSTSNFLCLGSITEYVLLRLAGLLFSIQDELARFFLGCQIHRGWSYNNQLKTEGTYQGTGVGTRTGTRACWVGHFLRIFRSCDEIIKIFTIAVGTRHQPNCMEIETCSSLVVTCRHMWLRILTLPTVFLRQIHTIRLIHRVTIRWACNQVTILAILLS